MEKLEALRRRVVGAESLLAIARVMKTLSAVRIRRCREAAEAVLEYDRTLELSIQAALRTRPAGAVLPDVEPAGPLASLVFGSDLGLAGQYNARVADLAAETLRRLPDRERGPTLAVGTRVQAHLEAAGVEATETRPAPADVERLADLAGELLVTLDRWRAEARIERISVFYNHYVSGSTYEPRRIRLLPLDPGWLRELEERPWPTRAIPAFRAGWAELFALLVREYLFVALVRAGAGAMASEHASRLAAMEQATRRIEGHLDELRSDFRRMRQTGITQELLEITAGYEALTGRGP